jgi:hypothetical protein
MRRLVRPCRTCRRLKGNHDQHEPPATKASSGRVADLNRIGYGAKQLISLAEHLADPWQLIGRSPAREHRPGGLALVPGAVAELDAM